MTDKELILDVVNRAPDDASAEQIMYQVYVRSAIERGLKDVREGRVLTHEQVKRSLQKWLK
jgi:predicted transcriptional regulator